MVDSTPLAWVLIALASMAIVLNAVILLSVLLSANLHTKCQYIFANWSAAHLCLNVAVLFRAALFLLHKRDKDELCRVVIGSETGGVSAVLFWAVTLASDRYVAIFWPTYYNRTSNVQLFVFSLTTWIVPVAIGVTLGLNVNNAANNCLLRTSLSAALYLLFVSSSVALCIGTVAFYAIILVLTTRRLRINGAAPSTSQRRRNDRDWRLLVTISVVLALFLVCQMARPTVSLVLYITSTADSLISQISAQLASVLAIMETYGNFITFAVRSEDYQQAFCSVLHCRLRAIPLRKHATQSISRSKSTSNSKRRNEFKELQSSITADAM